MIIASYTNPCDEAAAANIHVRDRTAMYRTDNKIFFRDISHIFSGSALWVHAKCAVKTHNIHIAYKWYTTTCLGETHWETAMMCVILQVDAYSTMARRRVSIGRNI